MLTAGTNRTPASTVVTTPEADTSAIRVRWGCVTSVWLWYATTNPLPPRFAATDGTDTKGCDRVMATSLPSAPAALTFLARMSLPFRRYATTAFAPSSTEALGRSSTAELKATEATLIRLPAEVYRLRRMS